MGLSRLIVDPMAYWRLGLPQEMFQDGATSYFRLIK